MKTPLIKTLLTTLLIIFIQSCAVSVKESNFILHDETVTAFDTEQFITINKIKKNIRALPVTIKHADGINSQGLWIKQQNSDAVIIYFSGNNMRINDSYEDILPELLSFNTDIVWLDHRGLGASEGKATLENLSQDGLDIFDYVKSKTDKKIILHGLSLGSFIAGNTAMNRPITALILEGSATTAADWVDELVPWYAKIFTRISIDEKFNIAGNENVVKSYHKPLFILVGENDEVTPVSLNQKLYDLSVSSDKHIFIAEGSAHGNAIKNTAAKSAIKSFISTL